MKKVLIVEDEIIIAEDLKSKLTNLNYTVVGTVYNKNKVSDKVHVQKPDLVLLDINLGDKNDGIEVAEVLNTKNIPFAFITSYSDEETIKKVQATNPVGYLVKPFTTEDIKVLLEMSFFRVNLRKAPKIPEIEIINSNLEEALSTHEYEIVEYIFQGFTNSQIANKKLVSINTIKSHIRNIYRKCQVNSKPNLINYLLQIK